MIAYETSDAVECFANARNLNAAVKKIIKSDSSKDPKTARFSKALKTAIKSPKEDSISAFVERAREDYEEHLFLAIRHAYSEQLDQILDGVIEKHAEEFNNTYIVDPMTGTITISDEGSFKSIGEQAIKMITDSVDAADIPSNGFMKKTAVYSLFDRAVLEALEERVKL